MGSCARSSSVVLSMNQHSTRLRVDYFKKEGIGGM